jgi:molecular chaperone GrpE (heat shock protein)
MLFSVVSPIPGGAVTDQEPPGGETADEEPPASGTADHEPSPDETKAALNELAARFGQVEQQLAEFHRRSAFRESVIDRLHEENQQLRGGIDRAVLSPVVADLIRLYDQLSQESHRPAANGQDHTKLLGSFADDVADILDRCGYERFTAEPGDAFDHRRHRPLATVPSPDVSQHNTVAHVVAAGFVERDTGRVRRPVHARFYQFRPDSGIEDS